MNMTAETNLRQLAQAFGHLFELFDTKDSSRSGQSAEACLQAAAFFIEQEMPADALLMLRNFKERWPKEPTEEWPEQRLTLLAEKASDTAMVAATQVMGNDELMKTVYMFKEVLHTLAFMADLTANPNLKQELKQQWLLSAKKVLDHYKEHVPALKRVLEVTGGNFGGSSNKANPIRREAVRRIARRMVLQRTKWPKRTYT